MRDAHLGLTDLLCVLYTISMRSGPFIEAVAHELRLPVSSVRVYARALKEAGLMSSGARGVNGAHMTPLDAARLVIALLATDKPAECVERVQRFGQIKYSPSFRRTIRGYVTIQPDEFAKLFEGETFEEVLAYLFGQPTRLGIERACEWFDQHVFHVRVEPFAVLGELFSPIREDGEITGERVVPFKGKVWADPVKGEKMPRHVEGWTIIKGGIRVQREVIGMMFLMIGIALMPEDEKEGGQ